MVTIANTPETWGEKFHRYYRRGRDAYDGITYRSLAQRISTLMPRVPDTAIMSLEMVDSLDQLDSRQRLIGFWTLVALGMTPDEIEAEFGITVDELPLAHMNVNSAIRSIKPRARKQSAKSSLRRHVSDVRIRVSPWTIESAGQHPFRRAV